VERAGVDPGAIDEVFMGSVVPAGLGQAPARQASIKAGIPAHVGAVTLNKVCGSGLKTAMMAAGLVKAGDGDVYVAGGMENMNMAPYLLQQGRTGYRLGHGQVLDACVHDGLWCAFEDQHMGLAAEWIAEAYDVSREEQDQFALQSHQKAIAAIDAGRFAEEIVPIEIPQRKGAPINFDTDESPRRDSSLEKLARLRPVFKKGGSVTAGNASAITDGAAAVVIMSQARATELGVQPLARITGYAHGAVEPLEIFTAPVFALRNLMAKTDQTLSDYDLFELNEAFAAQCLGDGKILADEGWDWDKVNVNGGAIALGHPIGCSGTRVLVTLLHALRQRNLKTGIASLCLGGGEAVAMSVEIEA
jgi:acetyl-CoA C-acetyltransferase